MQTEFIIISILIVIGFAIVIFVQLRSHGKSDGLSLLQNQMNNLSQTFDSRLGETGKEVTRQLKESNEVIREFTEKLTRLDETNKQVVNFTEQIRSLQNILKNPKQRGILGEYFLETVLKNVLPPGTYKTQFSFADKTTVDAVIFVKDKIIPVDSKFSLDNYEKMTQTEDDDEKKFFEKLFVQDIKNRINETSTYIKESEGTLNFAFMFIPSEAIYYDLLVNRVGSADLIEYAFREKHVVIVSPTSFLAYLQTVLQGLKSLQIEESAKDIIKHVANLNTHLEKYDLQFQKLGSHLGNTVGAYNASYKEFKKIDKDVVKITGSKSTLNSRGPKGEVTERSEVDRPLVD